MVSTQILSSTTVFGIDNSKNIRMISKKITSHCINIKLLWNNLYWIKLYCSENWINGC